MEDNKPKTTESQLPEAPASATVKIKSKDGFEWLFTMRDEKASVLMFKMRAMEKNWTENGFTPLAQNNGFKRETNPKEYVEEIVCPICKNRLVRSQTKTGKKLIKCETNKWNTMLQKAEGCPFVEWEKEIGPGQIEALPERDINDF